MKISGGGKNTSEEIQVGVNATSKIIDILNEAHRLVILQDGFDISLNADRWNNTQGGTGVAAALTTAAVRTGGVILNTGAGVGDSSLFTDNKYSNPTDTEYTEELVLEFKLEQTTAATMTTNTLYGLGTTAVAGLSDDVMGLRWKVGTTFEWVTDNGSAETTTDSAIDLGSGKSNKIKIVLSAGQVDFYFGDMDTPEATHTTNIPEENLFIIFHPYSGAIQNAAYISEVRLYTKPA